MTTLEEFMIIVGADNHPPMLEKSLCDSLKSHMELYTENQENGRMILNSLQNGPLVWPTIVEEDGTTRTKKYEELSITEKLQADCDLKATNILLQGLPPNVYAIMNHHKVAKEIWDRVKLLMQGTKLSLQEKECKLYGEFDKFSFLKGLVVLVFNKAMDFLTAVASSRFPLTNNQLRTSSNLKNQALFKTVGLLCNKFKGGKDKLMLVIAIRVMLLVLGEIIQEDMQGWLNVIIVKAHESGQILDEEQLAFHADPSILYGQATQTTILNIAAFQTEDLDAYDSDCDDVSNAKAVLMANLSNYVFDIILEVPHHEPYHTDMDNQSVHTMQDDVHLEMQSSESCMKCLNLDAELLNK
uniref:Integrase, catalytic region, zinc finger, CCHC-type, peptidase aspartic, catalytic n=1 Tax=Tanacetum cinerariifolium TaxID=118510 RepID=A0A6L2LGK9_TANCI|nr:hypothetical protein [Tanacetum cinerariifolium]